MTAKGSQLERPVRSMVSARVKELICSRGLRPGDRLPTYQQLIRDLGVSLVTVKRGLDDLEEEGIVLRRPPCGTFVAREVTQVPRELKHIGVIYPSSRHHLFTSSYASEIMRGISLDAPSFADIHNFSLREDGLIRAAQLSEWDIDGAILLGVENDDYLRTFAQWGTPGVVVDYCSPVAPLDYVACDNAAAAGTIVEHLAALGHRRVAYVGGPPQQVVKSPRDPEVTLLVRDSSDARERRAESLRALRERHLQVEDWTFSGSSLAGISATADKLQGSFRAADAPTVVLAGNNHGALNLVTELERRGLRVPSDISVCAVASDGDMEAGDRSLTCCRFDFTGMGRKAMALLAERRKTRPLEAPCVHRIGFEFVEGDTVGPVNGNARRRANESRMRGERVRFP